MQHMQWTREHYRNMDLRAQARMARIHGHLMRAELRRRLARATNAQRVAVAPIRVTYRWDWDRPVYRTPVVELPSRKPIAQAIILQVCRKREINYATIVGPNRIRNICEARHEAMHRLSTELGLSTPQIGRMLGGRDHSTVLHGIRKHRERSRLSVDTD